MRNAKSELMRTGPRIGMEEVWFNDLLAVGTTVAAFIYEVNKENVLSRTAHIEDKGTKTLSWEDLIK